MQHAAACKITAHALHTYYIYIERRKSLLVVEGCVRRAAGASLDIYRDKTQIQTEG
jgi:hypothetical protein